MTTKKKTKTAHRGRRPSKTEIAQMKVKGYVLPGVAAKKAGIALPTIYGWVRRGVIANLPTDARPAILRSGAGNVWILMAALNAAVKAAQPAAVSG